MNFSCAIRLGCSILFIRIYFVDCLHHMVLFGVANFNFTFVALHRFKG